MAFTQVIKTLGSVMASMKTAVDTWLSQNITNPSNPPLDRSLSLSNACAPADMVGDLKSAINDDKVRLNNDLSNVYQKVIGDNLHDPTYDVIGSIKSDGSIDTSATGYKTSDFIPVEQDTDYAFSGYVADGRKNTSSRLYVALYDSNKGFISGTYQNVPNTGMVTFDSDDASYARVCASSANFLLKKGTTTPNTFVAYAAEYNSKLNYEANSIPVSAIQEGFVKSELINLYNSANDVVGYIYSNGGIDPTGTNYKTTDYIPVVSGIKYRIEPRLRFLAFYTGTGGVSDYIADSRIDEQTSAYEFTSQYTGYMRISYAISYPLTKVLSLAVSTPTKKVQEGISLSNTQIEQIKEELNAKSILTGKKWVVCGDSFTNDGGTGTTIQSGKYAGKSYTYPWIIGNDDRQDMEIVQFFQGGRTLAFPAEPGTFVNSLTNPNADWYYQNIPADADYITIYLGINDEHHATGGGDGEDPTGYIPLGTITDNTTASYYGAWNVVLTWLITNRPNAHIGIIVTNGIANNDNYRLAQIAIAQKYGIPYIDMNGDQHTPAMLRTSNPNIPAEIKQALIEKWSANYPSNQHPNDAAQLFESTFIENFLMGL